MLGHERSGHPPRRSLSSEVYRTPPPVSPINNSECIANI